MKRKIIFGSIAILFAAASAFNIGLIQTKNAGDISLDAITIMAEAHDGEAGNIGNDCIILGATCYDFLDGTKACAAIISDPRGGDCNHCTCR